MTTQIKKILYTTDLSENSAYVFRHTINFAKRYDAKIIILHALEKTPPTIQALVGSEITEEEQQKILREKITHASNRIQKRLEVFCERELKEDPDCKDRVESIEVCEGFPPHIILRLADERNCDAIIMGTHAKGAIAYTFLGSTAKRVLRRTRKPVFIIPLPKGEIDITYHGI